MTHSRVRTVGVDLGSQPAKTAVCAISWRGDGTARVERPSRSATDDAVLAACLDNDVDRVGIDCPLGWPEPFVRAITAHRDGLAWPGRGRPGAVYQRELAYRATDRYVRDRTRRLPLTVSADKIGWVAWRCASLLDELAERGQPVNRDGTGRVCEVYPAAALHLWAMLAGPKSKAEVLSGLFDALLERAPGLEFADGAEHVCRASAHAFDALVCALVARAVQLGRTLLPETDEQRNRARSEGWIMLPTVTPAELLQPTAT